MSFPISVIVPCYNSEKTLVKTLESMKNQSFQNFELIVVDDASTDASASLAKSFGAKVISLSKRRGPAFARNKGIKAASGSILLFTDADCQPEPNWVETVMALLSEGNDGVVMGQVFVPESSFLANSIANLGFPAGGNAGFENIWPVSKDGFTSYLSSCNFAIRKHVIKKVNCFDQSLLYAGGEDTFLAFLLSKNNIRIKYSPKAIVWHEPTHSWAKFLKWQFIRGKANYQFRKRVGSVRKYIGLRLWSSKNILKKNVFSRYFPAVFLLLLLSFVLQQLGYFWESIRNFVGGN